MRFFDLLKLAEQGVVLAIADLWRVQHIVTVRVVLDDWPKLGGAGGEIHLGQDTAGASRLAGPKMPAIGGDFISVVRKVMAMLDSTNVPRLHGSRCCIFPLNSGPGYAADL